MEIDLIGKSRRCLRSCEVLIQDGDFEGACGRAYYAMFHSAKASLQCIGTESESLRTHNGVISSFNKKLSKEGLVEAKLGKLLSQHENLRISAEYRDEIRITEADANLAFQNAVHFVDAVEVFISQQCPDMLAHKPSLRIGELD